MAGVKPMFLAIVFQGFYLGSVCQEWTFPSTITALIGSCVEIPCTYDPVRRSGKSSAVWYLYGFIGYPEILNTKTRSSVKKEYKDRTSLVPGDNSCTLRIDPVRKGDKNEYYPGIVEDKSTNAYEKQSSSVKLDVTDSPEDIRLSMAEAVRGGVSTTMRCAAYHTCRSSPPFLRWNKLGQIKKRSVKISEGTWREDSDLTYIPSYEDDGTPVRCTATYPNGQNVMESSILHVSYSPQNVTVTIIGKDEVMEGSDVHLECSSFSRPDVYVYEWYKGKEKNKFPDTGRRIRIRNVTRETEPYSCTAINVVGRGESALMEIPVLYEAIGVHIIVKNETGFAELICYFLSSRPDVTHYTWMKDGSMLQNEIGKTLIIVNNVESNGRYSCIAHNSVGNSSSDEIYIKRCMVVFFLILGTLAGVFFPLIFILVIYFCVRNRNQKVTSSQAAESPNTTYSDLIKKDIEKEYEELKPGISTHIPNTGQHGAAINEQKISHK